MLLQQRISSCDAVDDEIEAVVGAEDTAEQRGDLALVGVIDAHRDGGAARRLDHRRRLVDGLGPAVRRRLAGDAAARAVDRRAGFGERASDAAAGAAGGAGDEGDASTQPFVRRFPVGHDRIFCRGSRGSAFSGCAPRTVIIVKLNKARVRVKETPCVVSVAEHTGWAHVVCVAARDRVPVVVARRRVALIDPGLPTLPYEHESSAMPHAEADALVAMVRRSIASRTAEALRRITTELAPEHAAVALAIRQPPFDDLSATVAEVRASYRLLCAADGMLYQLAICR